MNFFVIVFALFFISFLWAVYALIKEKSKPREVEKVKRELSRERIIFRS